jgi:hypothetical protein
MSDEHEGQVRNESKLPYGSHIAATGGDYGTDSVAPRR